MSKIHVTPLVDGFPVKDAEGNLIPAKGCKVEDTPVVRRRIHEGLLEVTNGAKTAADEGSEETDEFDLEKLTVAQLKTALVHEGVEVPDGAKKPALVELLANTLEAGSA